MRGNMMEPGDSLVAGGPILREGDGMMFALGVSTGGELRIFNEANGASWWTPPVGQTRISSATFTPEGDFVAYTGVYEDRKQVWASGTAGRGTDLYLMDGHLTIVDANKRPVWTSTHGLVGEPTEVPTTPEHDPNTPQ